MKIFTKYLLLSMQYITFALDKNQNLMAEQLIKGNRYFLDGRKDVSGIYEGPDKQGDAQFSGIQGDSPYGKDRKGFVVFQGDKPEITEETEFSEYED